MISIQCGFHGFVEGSFRLPAFRQRIPIMGDHAGDLSGRGTFGDDGSLAAFLQQVDWNGWLLGVNRDRSR
ncbi:MAG: hypothetical protein GY789_28460 [Hyphomicrobiales bacterium]|nr:hypothetical protein [Hyphomicrobiales bacterium]